MKTELFVIQPCIRDNVKSVQQGTNNDLVLFSSSKIRLNGNNLCANFVKCHKKS